jgi:hypothetical protein
MNFKNKTWDGTASTHNLQLYCEECGFRFGKHKATALAECPAMPLASTTQVGGSHYTSMKIQPFEYITANNLGFVEGSVIKYVSRWRNKNGVEDLKKARHFLDMLIESETAK